AAMLQHEWVVIESFFFFQAEDGIRDRNVTGVQTCALPICRNRRYRTPEYPQSARPAKWNSVRTAVQFLPGSVLYAGCAHSLLHRGRYRSNARKRERFPLRG